MLNDEIINEVREIRETHAACFKFDIWAIYEDLKKSQAERIAAGYPYVEPPVTLSRPDFQRIRSEATEL